MGMSFFTAGTEGMMTEPKKGRTPRRKKESNEAPQEKPETIAVAAEPIAEAEVTSEPTDSAAQTESATEAQEREVGLYEKLTARTSEILEDGRKTLDEALKKAKDEMTRAGDFSKEQVDRVGEFVRRDIIENAGKAVEAVKNAVDPHRLSAGIQDFIARILTSTADTISGLAQKTEENLEHKTGEPTSAGTLTCKECGAQMHLKHASRIPPCPKCHKTVFRKTY